MPQKNTQKTGFTLIELLVVIAIIGVLSSVVLASLNGVRAKARDARRISDFHQIQLALELFYDAYNRYPVYSPGFGGYPTWDEHWHVFATCLETGVDCGFAISGYVPVMTRVPRDPLDNPGFSATDPIYYTGWDGRTEYNYLLRAYFETNSSILNSDADGEYRSAVDGGCDDPWYCIKYNWPW